MMTNYRALFMFRSLPSYEILFVCDDKTMKYTGPPGIVALNIANTLIANNKSIYDIMRKFRDPKLDGFMNESMVFQSHSRRKINEHRYIMHDFIKTVFISQPENDTFEGAPSNNERISNYFKTNEHESLVKDVFSALSIKPFFNMPDNYEIASDRFELKGNEAESINLFITDKPKQSLEQNIDPKNSCINPNGNLFFTWDYESNKLFTIAWLELILMADAGVKIKNCHKCNVYFSPFPPNTLHCEKCREKHTAQSLYRERLKQRIEQLPENKRATLLKEEREKKAAYMREYRKKKRLSQGQNKSK